MLQVHLIGSLFKIKSDNRVMSDLIRNEMSKLYTLRDNSIAKHGF